MSDANAKVVWLRQHSVHTPSPPDYSEECERIDCRFNRHTLDNLLAEPDRSPSSRIGGWCLLIAGVLCAYACVVHTVWP